MTTEDSSEKLLTIKLELLSSSSWSLGAVAFRPREVKEVDAGGELEVGEAAELMLSS